MEKVPNLMSDNQYKMGHSRKVAIIAIMASLALVGNYALVAIPNVELGTTILFVTTYLFGFTIGTSSAIIMSIVFSVINPWGAFIPQIWLSQIIGWLFITVSGAIMRKQRPRDYIPPKYDTELMIAGAFLTMFFDLVTNLGYSWAFSVPYEVALITGLPFMIIHVISNALLFSLVIPRLHYITKHHLASVLWDIAPEQIDLLSEE
jgi:hypothetical protein